MKIAIVIVRILMGALFLFTVVAMVFKLVPEPKMTGNDKLFNEGLFAAGYLIPLLKAVEFICALAFLSGRFVALATVMIFPVTVNILGYHASLMQEGLPVAVFLLLGNLFLAFAYRKHYNGLFVAKRMA